MTRSKESSFEVFVSHSSKDKTWADAACAVLEGRRIRCWIAPRDITPGTEWGAAIIQGIDACRVMVVILSKNSNASPQVRREVERAITKEMAVLPFRVEDVVPDGALEYALGNTHWLDAFTPPVEHKMELLADSVEALLGRKRLAPPSQEEPEEEDSDDDIICTDPNPRIRWLIASAIATVLVLSLGAWAFLTDRSSASSDSESKTTLSESTESESIDLLALIRPMRDRRSGAWLHEENGPSIVSTGDPENPLHADVIQIPYILNTPSYRLEFSAEAMGFPEPQKANELQIGLPFPRTRCSVILGAGRGRFCGLSQIAGEGIDENPTRKETPMLFFRGQPTQFVITVNFTRPGNPTHIEVKADGKAILEWSGSTRELSLDQDYGTDRNSIFLATFDRKFRIDKLTLTPIGRPRSPSSKNVAQQ